MSQADVFYQAMLARDYRFDGKFFIGVKTTGIYCRPICPAKPLRKNIEFYTTSALAEKAGFRPCLRCRPECAPLSPAWYGKSAVVQRALRLIASHQLHEFQEEQFAAQFGMSARHLRRLFEQDIGQSPKQISDANRLNFARKLVVETGLPMTEVSTAAGFSSLRRFNDAFKKRFLRAPTQIRKSKLGLGDPEGIELTLAFRPPYRWEAILEFFNSHRISGVEEFHQGTYARVFKLNQKLGWLQVRLGDNALLLRVGVDDPAVLFTVVSRVRQMFDLDSDPLLITQSFSDQPLLARLTGKFPGLRLPGGWDPFEIVICSILGQLVSVTQARNLVGQLVENYGESVKHPASGLPTQIFPSAKTLATADLSLVKTTRARRATLREVSQKVLSREINLSVAQDPVRFRELLLGIKGIGPWTAEYISLRAIGDTDAFPKTDLILRRALELHPGLDLQAAQPWRSYAALYLWKEFAQSLSGRKVKL